MDLDYENPLIQIKANWYLETILVFGTGIICFYKCKIHFSFVGKNSIIDKIHKF